MSNYQDVEDFNNKSSKVKELQLKSISTPDLSKSDVDVYNKKNFLKSFLKLFKSQNNINGDVRNSKKKSDKKEMLSVSFEFNNLLFFIIDFIKYKTIGRRIREK